MKRLLVLVLVAILLVPGLSVADQDIIVSGSHQKYDNIKILGRNCLYDDDSGDFLWIYYELLNAGKNPLILDTDHSSIQFLDAEGNVFFDYYGREYATTDPSVTYTHLPIYPDRVEPGQRFFIVYNLYNNPDDNAEEAAAYQKILQASDYRLNLQLINYYEYRNFPYLPTTWTYRLNDIDPSAIELTMEITNNTDDLIPGVEILYIIRDANGTPVLIETRIEFSLNIAPGQTANLQITDYSPALEFLQKHNFDITNVEVLVYRFG